MNKAVLEGRGLNPLFLVRATDPERQLVEVLQRFELFNRVAPFQRCMRCNGLLEPVAKESILDQLPPKIQLSIHEFHRCRECGQIYWRGSHFERMQQFIEGVLGQTKESYKNYSYLNSDLENPSS